jgi:hypothetical protein
MADAHGQPVADIDGAVIVHVIDTSNETQAMQVLREENACLRSKLASFESRHHDDLFRLNAQIGQLKNQLVDQEHNKETRKKLREDNAEFRKELMALKKREFELMMDNQEAMKQVVDKESLRIRRQEADRLILEANSQLEAAERYYENARQLSDRRSQDQMMIETLKREKQRYRLNYEAVVRDRDMLRVELKKTKKDVVEAKTTVDLVLAKAQGVSSEHAEDNQRMTGMVFAMQKVIGHLHERMLSLMANAGEQDFSEEQSDACMYFSSLAGRLSHDDDGLKVPGVRRRATSSTACSTSIACSLPIACIRSTDTITRPGTRQTSNCPFKEIIAEYTRMFGRLADSTRFEGFKAI